MRAHIRAHSCSRRHTHTHAYAHIHIFALPTFTPLFTWIRLNPVSRQIYIRMKRLLQKRPITTDLWKRPTKRDLQKRPVPCKCQMRAGRTHWGVSSVRQFDWRSFHESLFKAFVDTYTYWAIRCGLGAQIESFANWVAKDTPLQDIFCFAVGKLWILNPKYSLQNHRFPKPKTFKIQLTRQICSEEGAH